MKSITCILIVISFVASSSILSGQSFSVAGKAGVSSGANIFGSDWKPAPILGYGVRMRTGKAFAFEGILDYTAHTYSPYPRESPPVNDPLNRILEFHVIWRLSILLYEPVYFDFLVGFGLAHQDVDDIHYTSTDSKKGFRRTGQSRIFGVALEARISERYELSLEGSLRVRDYPCLVAQLSLSYALE